MSEDLLQNKQKATLKISVALFVLPQNLLFTN